MSDLSSWSLLRRLAPALLILAAAAQSQTTTRVSVASDGTQANAASAPAEMSADGTTVAFVSAASNLVAGDGNGTSDIFVHELATGITSRVNLGAGGVEGDAPCLDVALSATGRFVAFDSLAGSLVASDQNEAFDVFRVDRQTGEVRRVSEGTGGVEANGPSHRPDISGNGSAIVFASYATNLVAGDRNRAKDIFLHLVAANSTTRVNVRTGGQQAIGGDSDNPAISQDGRYIVYDSTATNLVPNDTNAARDIFLFDRFDLTTERVSIASDGTEANDHSRRASVSGDGRYVVFESLASNLVPNDLNGFYDIFLHDRQTGETTRINDNPALTEPNSQSFLPYVNGPGTHVAFYSCASNIVPNDPNGADDIFIYDIAARTLELASVDFSGGPTNGYSSHPSVSDTARYVAFSADASDIVTGDTNGMRDVFLRDRASVAMESPDSGTSVAWSLLHGEGEEGNRLLVLFSGTGIDPTPIPGTSRVLMLTPDIWTQQGLAYAALFSATIDATGHARTTVVPVPPLLSGLRLFAAGLILDPSGQLSATTLPAECILP
ncbi:MAG: hypothetical protein RL885_27315 [Planctomycetota bacterium]